MQTFALFNKNICAWSGVKVGVFDVSLQKKAAIGKNEASFYLCLLHFFSKRKPN